MAGSVILVPLDFTEVNKSMVKIADEWAQRAGDTLYFLHVVDDLTNRQIVSDVENVFGTRDALVVENLKEQIEEFIYPLHVRSPYQCMIRQGKVYLEILEAYKEYNARLITMAAHEHTILGRMFMGSNTDYVLHHSTCPVYVHKENSNWENKIIVPVDYTEVNKSVIQMANEWALHTNAELYFIYVSEINVHSIHDPTAGEMVFSGQSISLNEDEEERLYKIISGEESQLNDFITSQQVTAKFKLFQEFGKPYLKIMELQQEERAGLIIMAAHSHTLSERMFIGSNSDYLLHHAHCPIYIHKDINIDRTYPSLHTQTTNQEIDSTLYL